MSLTAKEKTKFNKLKKELNEIERLQQEILDELRLLQEKFRQFAEAKEQLMPELQKLKTKEILSKEVKDWTALLDNNDSTTYKALQQVFPWNSPLVFKGSIWTNTNQRVLTLCLYKNHPEDDELVTHKIIEVIPYLIPVEDGKVFISIFENSLSQHGSYHLQINPASPFAAEITMTRYGRKSVVKEFPELKDAISFIRENLWYEENKGE